MKVTAEYYDVKVEISMERDDLTITEMVDELIYPLLLGMGYNFENVNKVLYGDKNGK